QRARARSGRGTAMPDLVLVPDASEILQLPCIIRRNRFWSEQPVMTARPLLQALLLSASLMSSTVPVAHAASCGGGSFDAWLTDFKTEAAAKGISQSAITAGLNGVTLDQSVLSRDRSPQVFQ